MSVIHNLVNDRNFKADYLIKLLENRMKITQYEAEIAWRGVVKAIQQCDFEHQQRRVATDLESLRESVLHSAELGLSLCKDAKECFLGVYDDCGQSKLKLGFCYRGLRRLLLRNPQVKRFSSSVVYDDDSFEWRGECERPFISSSGRSSGNIVAAYAWIELHNGDITSVMLNAADLEGIESRDVERAIHFCGSEMASIYRGTWRKRMFEIDAFKALFRDCGDIVKLASFNEGDVFGSASTVGNLD